MIHRKMNVSEQTF